MAHLGNYSKVVKCSVTVNITYRKQRCICTCPTSNCVNNKNHHITVIKRHKTEKYYFQRNE